MISASWSDVGVRFFPPPRGALQATLVKLKQEIKAGKRTMDRDLLGKLDETKLNLKRFIKYKAAQF